MNDLPSATSSDHYNQLCSTHMCQMNQLQQVPLSPPSSSSIDRGMKTPTSHNDMKKRRTGLVCSFTSHHHGEGQVERYAQEKEGYCYSPTPDLMKECYDDTHPHKRSIVCDVLENFNDAGGNRSNNTNNNFRKIFNCTSRRYSRHHNNSNRKHISRFIIWDGWTCSSYLTIMVTTTFLLLSLCVDRTISGGAAVDEPEFAEPIENITIPAGREVKLACSVKNLGPHKVAWIHFEGSAILTVQTHVITRNPRIKVTHDKHRTWYLHIEDVQESDAGRYMCQINTETAKTTFGYLHVVVPPNIDDSMSSSDVIVRENSNVSLSCHATGSPEPEVKWRREDSGEIRINRTYTVTEWYGETLDLSRISRLDMGAYMCIASNGVPPGVSKRIKVSVDFPPMLWIPYQLVGAPQGSTATLECSTEAHPASLNYWTGEDGHMIHDSRKYRSANDVGSPQYKTHMKLTIFDIQQKDFGVYKCVAKNPRGETEGKITLYESAPPTTTTIPTTTTKMSYRRQKGKDQKDSGASNRNPSSLAIEFSEGGEFSSNMNTVDKSQIRSTKSTTKGASGVVGGSGGGGIGNSDWPEGNSPSSGGSCVQKSIFHPLILTTFVTVASTISHISSSSFH